ncbi:MAG TPA: hypothetical protein VMU25_02985 [Candidatus Paceibacterota bacterium]|nr:hypothetical protein [Candidatus Paceibacterota bacterium]
MPNLPTFKTMKYRFLRDYSVAHVYRIHGGSGERLFESPVKNTVGYTKGVHVFTVHYRMMPDGKMHTLYSNKHGWALTDDHVRQLIKDRIIEPSRM